MTAKPPSNGDDTVLKNEQEPQKEMVVSKDAAIELVADVAEEAAARGADRAIDDFREEIISESHRVSALPKEPHSVPGWVSAVIGAFMATVLALVSYVWLGSETKATALIAKDKINVVEEQQKKDTIRFKKWIKVNNTQHKVITEQSTRTDKNIEKILKKMNLEPEPAPPPAPDAPDYLDDLEL